MLIRERPTGPVFKEALLPMEAKEFDIDGTIRFVASSEAVDRYGDIVRADGWDLSQYKQNPIVLFSHNNSMPVGRTPWVGIERKQLISDIKVASAGSGPVVDYVRALLEQRILRAVSVGFLPTVEPKYIRDEKNDRITGIEFIGQELLEISIVSVPANPEALALAKDFKISDDVLCKLLLPANRGISSQRARTELEKLRARSR